MTKEKDWKVTSEECRKTIEQRGLKGILVRHCSVCSEPLFYHFEEVRNTGFDYIEMNVPPDYLLAGFSSQCGCTAPGYGGIDLVSWENVADFFNRKGEDLWKEKVLGIKSDVNKQEQD